MFPGRKKIGLDPESPWLAPLGSTVLRGRLRGMVNQYGDTDGNIFTPKGQPSIKKTRYTYIQGLAS